ncbi:hypothetical protein [Sediminibacillus halophilus]|uniref:hypothetical protein n=1 Tax=Sediminibacillus halophilus TaxID=482461 RepID=UPI001FE1DC08|nr:hypothetical protein [Sediminibacillus halophilus]
MIEQLYEQIDLNETDLFKRIENIGLQKLCIHQKYPHVFDFLASSTQEESDEVKDILRQQIERIYEQGFEKIYDGIDYSKFREGVDIDKAIEILTWTMSGFGEKGLQQIDSFEDIGEFGEQFLKEWKSYSEILRHSFYK